MQEKILNPQWVYDRIINEARSQAAKWSENSQAGIERPFNVGSIKVDQTVIERLANHIKVIWRH